MKEHFYYCLASNVPSSLEDLEPGKTKTLEGLLLVVAPDGQPIEKTNEAAKERWGIVVEKAIDEGRIDGGHLMNFMLEVPKGTELPERPGQRDITEGYQGTSFHGEMDKKGFFRRIQEMKPN